MDIKTLDRFLMTQVNIYFPFINAPISLKAFCTRCGKIFCAIKTKKIAKRKNFVNFTFRNSADDVALLS